MRLLALAAAALLASLPLSGRAQLAPRSVALELGLLSESAPRLGERAPVGLAASWWIADDLDLAARISFAVAGRTSGRAADDLYEAGLRLRRVFGAGPLRPFASAEVGLLQLSAGPLLGWEQGVRLGGGAGVELFLARDLSLAAAAVASEAVLASGSGSSLGLALRIAGYF